LWLPPWVARASSRGLGLLVFGAENTMSVATRQELLGLVFAQARAALLPVRE
jgi:hypothetical protein